MGVPEQRIHYPLVRAPTPNGAVISLLVLFCSVNRIGTTPYICIELNIARDKSFPPPTLRNSMQQITQCACHLNCSSRIVIRIHVRVGIIIDTPTRSESSQLWTSAS